MFVCWDLGFGEGGVWPLWVDFFVKNKEHFLFRSKVFMDLAQMEVFCFFFSPSHLGCLSNDYNLPIIIKISNSFCLFILFSFLLFFNLLQEKPSINCSSSYLHYNSAFR